MDAATCLVILRAADDGKFTGEQCRHAFLRTVYSLILVEERGREDSEGKEESEEDENEVAEEDEATWEQCLLASHTSRVLELPDFCEAVVQLLGSMRARQPTVQYAALLTDFISRSAITSSINTYLSTRQLNAVEWMAVASLSRLGLLLPVSYESLTVSAGSELASLLQLTSNQWDVEISASVRMRTESVLCFLSKAYEDRSILVDDCCYDALLALTLRLEAGFLAAAAVARAAVDEGGQAKTEDDSGGEASDEEEVALGFPARKANQKVTSTVEAAESGGDVAQSATRGATVLHRSRLLEDRWQDEIALPPHRTRWCDMCLTSILRIMRQCLLKTASASPSPAKFGLSNYLGMLTSPCWQRQLLALQFIKSAITAEACGRKGGHAVDVVPAPALKQAITSERKNRPGKGEKASISAATTNRGEGGGGGSLKASKFQNGANRRSSNRGPGKNIEELCKNGALRPVCWLLVHKVEAIRTLARDIVQLLLDFYNEIGEAQAGGEGGGGTTGSVEMWASLVEQGIVPLLATILSGSSISSHVQTGLAAVPVVDAPLAKFPEETTRLHIATLLSALAKCTQETPSLRSRLSSALLFSGNFALRLNIFTGLVFLTGLSPSLGHSLWLLSNNQSQQKEALREISFRQSDEGEGCKSQGLVFRLMLDNLCKEPTGLKQIILVISHVLRYAVLYKGNDDESLAKVVRAPPPSQSSLLSQLLGGGATVLVSGEGGLMTKMVCPTSASVTQRSAKLAAFLKRLEGEASDCLETLPGSYAVWQEVFSHTVDDYLLVTSAERMATDAIIDAYHLARLYDIQNLLVKYGSILSKRLTSVTLVATLECALGLGRDSFMAANLPLPAPASSSDSIVAPIETAHPSSSSYHGQHLIHMNLLSLCFSYMGKNTNVIFSSRFPQRAVEITILIHQALKFVLVRGAP